MGWERALVDVGTCARTHGGGEGSREDGGGASCGRPRTLYIVTCKVAFTAGSRENIREAPPVAEEKPKDQFVRENKGIADQLRPPFTELKASAEGD